MNLHWSPKSPYVRKVLILSHELGIADKITLTRSVAAMSTINAELSADNPLNKLPTLVCDDGRRLFDSRVICEFLDAEGKFHPADKAMRIDALRRQALGDGLTDLLILRRNERDRPPARQSAPHLDAWKKKAANTLDVMERESAVFSGQPLDIGHIAMGCALSYIDFRFADETWRDGRPSLANWATRFEARPSAQAAALKEMP